MEDRLILREETGDRRVAVCMHLENRNDRFLQKIHVEELAKMAQRQAIKKALDDPNTAFIQGPLFKEEESHEQDTKSDQYFTSPNGARCYRAADQMGD